MSVIHLTLVMPQLFNRCQHEDTSELQFLPLLLGRSSHSGETSVEFERLIFQLFKFDVTNESLPIAAVTGLADGIDTRQGYWLRVDPVEYRADLAAIYLLGNQHLADDAQKLELFINEFSQMLQQENIILHTPDNKRWYFQTEQNPQVNTFLLDNVIGKDVGRFQLLGAKALYWQKIMTEMQMLLYMHGYGQKEGLMNGFWLWGEGKLPSPFPVHWDHVWSDEPLAKGLATLTSTPVKELPSDYSVCNQQMKEPGYYLLVNSALENKSLLSLDNVWFKPIVAALKNKSLTQLDLYFGNGQIYSVTSRSINYFWKRPRLTFTS